MADCIFCKIGSKNIPAKIVYEDEHMVAFHDIHPKAKIHVLLIPKHHIQSLNEVSVDEGLLIANMLLTLPKLAKELGLNQGFRTVINTGSGGGQVIDHLHFHLLGGSSLSAL